MFFMVIVMGCTGMAVMGAGLGSNSIAITCSGVALIAFTAWVAK
jgi:hypothetical protein